MIKKSILISVIIVIVLGIGGYYYLFVMGGVKLSPRNSLVSQESLKISQEFECQCGLECVVCRAKCVLCLNPFDRRYPGADWCLKHSLYCANPMNSIFLPCPECGSLNLG